MRFKLMKDDVNGGTYMKAVLSYEQIKLNLADMASGSSSPTPKAALERIEQLEAAMHRLAYWFDTDQEILDTMTAQERDCHIRMHKLALDSLF
jgi:hypothetical protein